MYIENFALLEIMQDLEDDVSTGELDDQLEEDDEEYEDDIIDQDDYVEEGEEL